MQTLSSITIFFPSLHPVVYIELVSTLASLAALAFVMRGWKRSGFLRAVPILLVLLLVMMLFYSASLFLEWSGFSRRFQWHYIEDFTGLFIPFIWAFVFYAILKNTVEENLRTSRKHFRNLVESTSDWIWETDAAWRYTYVSPRVEAILGYTPDEILGKTPFDLMRSEEAERVSAVFLEIMSREGNLRDFINVNRRKNGHEVTLETNANPFFDSSGKLVGYRGVDRDVTRRLEIERRQRQQQAELDSIFRLSPAGIGLVRNRYLVRGNERFFEITGYAEDEMINADLRRLYQSDQEFLDVGEKFIEARTTGFARIEIRLIRKDQTPVDVVLYFSPLEKGHPDTGFVVVMQDITALKAARQETLAEKARAQTYLNVVNAIILVLDKDGRVTMINKKGCKILERSAEQIEGLNWFEMYVPPSYRDISRNAFDRMIKGDEKSVAYFENPVRSFSGQERLIAWHNAALRDESGKIIGAVCSGEDITDSRAAEQAKRASDQQLRVALSSAKMGTWQWCAATNRDTFDDSLKKLLGLTDQQADEAYEDLFVFAHPDDREAAKAEFDRAIREHNTYLAYFRIVRPDGEIRWVQDQGKAFYDYNGKLEYMTGVVVDITERHKAEEAILQSQKSLKREVELFESMFHTIPDSLYIKDLDSRFTHVNEAWIKHMGLQDEQQVIGKTDFDIFTEAHARPAFEDEQKVMKTGVPKVGYEEKETWADGRVAWCMSTKIPLRDVQGNISGMIGISHDITDRKRAEKALRQSEERLRVALSAAKMGTWRWQFETDEDVRDANLNAILGLSAEETTQSKEDFFKFIHPDDSQAARSECERAIREKSSCQIQFRIIRPDGRVRWVMDKGRPFFDADGEPEYMTGVLVDVTEQTEYEMQYQNIVDSAPIGILTYELDADNRLVLIGSNKTANTIFGVTFSASTGKTIEEVFPAIAETTLPDEFRRICKEGGKYHGENFHYQDAFISGCYTFDAFQISPRKMAVLFVDVPEPKASQ